MKLINERTQIREVATRWRLQYPESGRYGKDPIKQGIANSLSALNVETATADDVFAIIGNRSWCEPQKCHECGETFDEVVMVGEEPDYESSTAKLCVDCLRKAIALIELSFGLHASQQPHAGDGATGAQSDVQSLSSDSSGDAASSKPPSA